MKRLKNKYKYGKSTNHKPIRKRKVGLADSLSLGTDSLSLSWPPTLSLSIGRLWIGPVMNIHNMIYNINRVVFSEIVSFYLAFFDIHIIPI